MSLTHSSGKCQRLLLWLWLWLSNDLQQHTRGERRVRTRSYFFVTKNTERQFFSKFCKHSSVWASEIMIMVMLLF